MSLIQSKKVTVFGCGAWALTIANILAQNGHSVSLYAYKQSVVDEINTTHKREKLPGISLVTSIRATSSLEDAVNDSQAIIVCMPSNYIQETLALWKPHFNQSIPVLCLTKGIVSESELFLSNVFEEALKNIDFALLSGPNLALEIAQGKPAASVVATPNQQTAVFFQALLSNKNFRVYTSTDIVGVACGGILKNIMAIASGCIDALDFGLNTKSLLITRSLVEIMAFGKALGAKQQTFYGLSGLGDLIATCNSPLSRNYQFGYEIGKEETLPEIKKKMSYIAEGVFTTKCIHLFAKKNNISMPITQTVYSVLYENKNIKESIYQLMTRQLKEE